MPFSESYIRIPTVAVGVITDTETTDPVKIGEGATPFGSVVTKIIASSNSSTPHTIRLTMNPPAGGVLGSVTIPLQAGSLGNQAVDLLKLVLADPVVDLVLPPGVELYVNAEVTLWGTDELHFTVIGGDF